MVRGLLSIKTSLAALTCVALTGCSAVEVVSPGAKGLAPEQSAWIISDDDVQIVSLDGTVLHSSVTLHNDMFLDGVRDKLQVEPGVHEVAVRMDNDVYAAREATKLSIDTRAATTYHITVDYQPVRYSVRELAGIPTKELLKQLD